MGDDLPVGPGSELRRLAAPASGRVDAVLAAALPDLTRARIQRLIAAGHVRREEGGALRKSEQVAVGEMLTVELPAQRIAAPAETFHLPVLFEDDDIVAIDKPAGLATHGAPGDTGRSVATWFAARYPGASEGDADRPGIVHRLDKDTSGVLILAKTPAAQAALGEAFQSREARKTYLALTEGVPDRSRAVIDAPIARHPGDRMRMTVGKRGRESRTEYEVIGSSRGRAFLLVRPATGRTHQIRVHLAAIACPVAGDRVYGRAAEFRRQMLHAWRLEIPHPRGGTLTITSAVPADFEAALRDLGLSEDWSEYTGSVPADRQTAAR